MMRTPAWRLGLRVLGLLILLASIVWLIVQPGFEPLVGFLTALVSLLGSFAPGDDRAAAASADGVDQRNRSTLLNHVRNFWVNGVLRNSLHGAALIELGMEEHPDAVATPWEMVLQLPNRERQHLPPGTQIADVFNDRGRSLLILGAPGSGKTTTLLQLAQDCINRAEQDPGEPMPVVFNLSTWVGGRGDMTGWLVDELNSKYQVPKRIGNTWVESDHLLLLLDGLDEIRPEHQAGCVEAINRFCGEHGLTPLVVSSRTEEYETLGNRLQLRGASLLQPLTPEQVDDYLARGGEQLAGVRHALRDDPALQELAQTPLILSIMTLAYQGMPVEALPTLDIEERRRHLFDAYVRRMFERRGAATRYSPEQTVRWLSWMARKMPEHAQSVFLIERMQPGWLDTSAQRRLYATATRIVGGLASGLVVGVLGGLLEALVGWMIFGSHAALVIGLEGGVIVGLGSLVGGALLVGQSARRDIDTIETLKWSWAGARNGLLVGLLGGLIGGLAGWLFAGPSGLLIGPIAGLSFGLSLGLVGGLSGRHVETRTIPNQGIRQSAKNAAIIGLSSALLVGLIGGVSVGMVVAGGSNWELAGLTVGLIVGIGGGLVVGMIGALVFGGRAVLQHSILRAILTRSGCIPWKFADFLDYGVDRIFLRKVGGGYIFVHRLLMDYFAELEAGTG